MPTFSFKIYRYGSRSNVPSRYDIFELQLDESASVLDALEVIRTTRDPSLMYRHSCHHSSCGTCACRINGRERLACTTLVKDLGGGQILVEPLKGMPVVADLVVEMKDFFRYIPPEWGHIRRSEWNPQADTPWGQSPKGRMSQGRTSQGLERAIEGYTRFESCIECGACVSACPAAAGGPGSFMGPAALAALNRELEKSLGGENGSRQDEAAEKNGGRGKRANKLLALAAGDRGESKCVRALQCSAVCPTRVFPARHILELRRMVREIVDSSGQK